MAGTSSQTQTCLQCGWQTDTNGTVCAACGSLLLLSTPSASEQHNAIPLDGPPPSDVFPSGTSVGAHERYRIDDLIGRGGFGQAYKAFDTHLERPCVVKRLVRPPDCTENYWHILCVNFAREARLLVSLNTPGHPNIPEIYEYLPDYFCLVMKYIAGKSLAELLAEHGAPLPAADALRYVRDVCSALVYMHSSTPEPVLHRDIKPANILLDSTGRVWLIDFGLAKTLPLPASQGNGSVSLGAGTVGYTPLEQWRGMAVPRSDVYALAMTLHTLLTYQQPPLQQVSNPVIAFDLPLPLQRLIERCTIADVGERPSAQVVLAELEALLDPDVAAPPEPLLPPLVADFVGRQQELALLAERLSTHSQVVMVGMAGVGKTALAAALAARVASSDRLCWHTFHPGEGVAGVLWRMAAFLARQGQAQLWRLLHTSAQLPALDLLCDSLLDLLRGQQYLICCDDVHWGEDDPQIVQLMVGLRRAAQAGDLQLILTSRHLPGFVPASVATYLAGLGAADARLLLDRQAQPLPDPLVEQLLDATEGNVQLLLLAIDAMRQSGDPAQQLADLAAVNDIEHYLLYEVDTRLSERERAVMGAVSIMGGAGGTSDAIEALLETGGVRRMLADLVRRSLVQVRVGTGARTYSQHSIIQTFYYANLGKRERQALHRRAGNFYEHEERDPFKAAQHYQRAGEHLQAAALATADVAALINQGHGMALEQLLASLPTERFDPALAAAVHTAHGEVAALLGNYSLARTALETALAQPQLAQAHGDLLPTVQADHAAIQARCYRLLALVHERTGDYAAAEAACHMGLDLVASQGKASSEAALLYAQLAEVAWRRSKFAAVETACQAGLMALPPAPAAPRERAALMQRLALVDGGRGHYAAAIAGLERSLPLARQSGDLMLTAAVLHNLGMYAQRTGQRERALDCYTESLQIKERIGDVAGRVRTLINQGSIYQERGEYDTALGCLDAARSICERLNLAEPLAEVRSNSGVIHLLQNSLEDAAANFHAALAIDRQLDNSIGVADSLYRLGDTALAQGDPSSAQSYGEQAYALAQQIDSAAYKSCALRVIGEAHLHHARIDAAATALHTALQLQHEVGDPHDQTLILLALTRLALIQEDETEALTYCETGLALAREHQFPYQIKLLADLWAQIKGEGASSCM